MTKTKWCVIQKTKTNTKSEFAVKTNTGALKLCLKSLSIINSSIF